MDGVRCPSSVSGAHPIDPQRRRIAQRQVQHDLGGRVQSGVIRPRRVDLHRAGIAAQLGPGGDVFDRAAQRIGAVKRALRPVQHLHAVHIEQVEVEALRAEAELRTGPDRHVVEV